MGSMGKGLATTEFIINWVPDRVRNDAAHEPEGFRRVGRKLGRHGKDCKNYG